VDAEKKASRGWEEREMERDATAFSYS
jgi:hypothetical protein